MTNIFNFLDIVEDKSGGNKKIPQSEYLEKGNIPVIDQGQAFIAGYTDREEYLFSSTELPVVIFGDHTKAVKYIDFPFAMGADGVKVLKPKDGLDTKYFYHFLKYTPITDAGYSRHFKFLKEKLVPVPPLEEQRRIASILDKADDIRQKRHQAIAKLDELLQATFIDMFGDLNKNEKGWIKKPLSELVVIDAPLVDPNTDEHENLLHYGPDRISKDTGQLLPALTVKEDMLISKKFLCDGRHILYSKIRPYLNKVALVKEKCLCSADVYPVEPRSCLKKYFLWNILRSNSFLEHAETFSNRANIPKINRQQFLQYECIVPSLEVQSKFEKIAQHLENERNNLLSQQYELDNLFNSLQQKAFNGTL